VTGVAPTTYTITFTTNVTACAATATPTTLPPAATTMSAAVASSDTVQVVTSVPGVGFNLVLACGGT
jgi:hypothetical protein